MEDDTTSNLCHVVYLSKYIRTVSSSYINYEDNKRNNSNDPYTVRRPGSRYRLFTVNVLNLSFGMEIQVKSKLVNKV